MAQNEVARATIEVELMTVRGDVCFKCQGAESFTVPISPHDNCKSLNPAAEAILNPKNELEDIARMIWSHLCPSTSWPRNRQDSRCYAEKQCYAAAREVCRMIAENIKGVILHIHMGDGYTVGCPCDACKRIAELEEMAKGD